MKIPTASIYHFITAIICSLYALFLINYYQPPSTPVFAFRDHLAVNLIARAIICVSVVVVIYSIIKVLFFRKKIAGWHLLIDSSLLAFVAANGVASILMSPPSVEGQYIVSETIVTPDSVSGYRYITGTHRQVYAYNNKVNFDVQFRANNKGYVSDTDYYPAKKKRGKRWIVLGDSFTSENYNTTNWVNIINQKLSEDSLDENEFYSFSLEGAGVGTWHSIFFKDILPNYEFDGLILAVYGEDIFREPIVLYETPNSVNCAYFDSLTGNGNLQANEQDFGGSPISWKAPGSKIDSLVTIATTQQGAINFFYPVLFEQYLVPALVRVVNSIRFNLVTNHDAELSTEEILQQIEALSRGKLGLRLFKEIISECKRANKQVIVCSIPDKDVVEMQFAKPMNEEALVNAIAKRAKADYFSGYKCFYDKSQQTVSDCFHIDGHWNTRGSAIFADSFYLFMKTDNYLEKDSLPINPSPL